MKYAIKILIILLSILLATFFLLLSDFSFSLSLIYRPLFLGAVFLTLLSALALIPALKDSSTIWKQWPKITVLIFMFSWSSVALLAMTSIRSARQTQFNEAYSNEVGNCTTLFTPLIQSNAWQRWMSTQPPFLRYGYAVLEDTCRVSRLQAQVAASPSAVCNSKGIPNPTSCYRSLLDELTSHTSLTTPGVALAMFDGMNVSMQSRTPDNFNDPVQRDLKEYRLAADTFGLVEATLRACQSHASPSYILGSKTETLTSSDPEWEAIKIIYRAHGMFQQDQVQLLSQMDREFEISLVNELFSSIKRINSRIKKLNQQNSGPVKTEAMAEIDSYKYEIDQYNQFFQKIEPTFWFRKLSTKTGPKT